MNNSKEKQLIPPSQEKHMAAISKGLNGTTLSQLLSESRSETPLKHTKLSGRLWPLIMPNVHFSRLNVIGIRVTIAISTDSSRSLGWAEVDFDPLVETLSRYGEVSLSRTDEVASKKFGALTMSRLTVQNTLQRE